MPSPYHINSNYLNSEHSTQVNERNTNRDITHDLSSKPRFVLWIGWLVDHLAISLASIVRDRAGNLNDPISTKHEIHLSYVVNTIKHRAHPALFALNRHKFQFAYTTTSKIFRQI